jgi:superoxide dismutase, Fe-Mn family
MFKLPPLPYEYDALEPAISADTLEFHHGKHHKKYVETTNALLKEKGSKPRSLEEVVRTSDGKLFNNAAQAWNHAFFWHCMTPDKSSPGGEMTEAIQSAFGDLAGLKKVFVEEANSHFASGWAWIVTNEAGMLQVISTHDADTPIAHGLTPILTCDVWEHAYYLDYQNDRKAFVEAWFDRLANWRFAQNQLRALMGAGELFRYPSPEDQIAEKTPRDEASREAGARPA